MVVIGLGKVQRARRSFPVPGLALVAVAVIAGCVQPPRPSESASAGTQFSIDLVVGSVSGLPACTSANAGTTAFVQSPPGLWGCYGSGWVQIS